MDHVKADMTLDAKGLACPMPIVKTKKAIKELDAGKVIEVQATDKGSTADLKAWANSSGHQYIGTMENDGVLKHYVRKSSHDDKIEKKYEAIMENHILEEKLTNHESLLVLDVREASEFAFNHIPGALSIPMGELDDRIDGLQKDVDIAVICRTGNRSDLAAKKLVDHGFTKVFNVIPGMTQWNGPLESIAK